MSTASPPAGVSPAVQLNDYLWLRLPLKVGKVSVTLGSLIADGAYMAGWRSVGGLVLPAAFVLGFVLGWRHLGYFENFHIVYLYSMMTMVPLVLVSQLGTGVGLALWLGFAIGDWSWATSPGAYQAPFLAKFGSRLLADVLLAGLLVGIPAASRGLANKLLKAPALGPDTGERFPARAAVQAVLAFALVYLWCQSTSVQLQAIFTWAGITPRTHGLFTTMARESWTLGFAAAYASIMRSVIEAAAARTPGHRERMRDLRRGIAACRGRYTLAGGLLGAVLKAALIVLTFGAFLASWTQAFMAYAAVLAALVVREVAFGHLGVGASLTSKVPFVVRLPLAFGLAVFISQTIVKTYWDKSGTFVPILIGALVSIIVYAALMPERAARKAAAAPEKGA